MFRSRELQALFEKQRFVLDRALPGCVTPLTTAWFGWICIGKLTGV